MALQHSVEGADEAARGCYFFNLAPELSATADEFMQLQAELAELVGVCTESTSPISMRRLEPQIRLLTDCLGSIFSGHEGFISVDNLSSSGPSPAEFVVNQQTGRGFIVPTSRITAVQANPQWYGSGFDVRPVINLRVQETEHIVDEPPAGQNKLGRWHQIQLASARVVLINGFDYE